MTLVLDTNIFVAAGFRPNSASGQLIEAVRRGDVYLAWNEQTRRETERIVRKIPRLRWDDFADLFGDEDCFEEETHPELYAFIPDPDDRKFAALAEAAGVPLVTTDRHLLDYRHRLGIPVLTPGELEANWDTDKH